VQRDFAGRLSVHVVQPTGANRKAAMLHHLAGQTSQALLVAVDSDMRATPDYLGRVVAPLADPHSGLVTCLYKGLEPGNLTARLEALHMSAGFAPLVLVARQFLAMRFALGATMALRREDLERLGGFAAVSAYLADDYQLGERMAGLGRRVHLSHYVIGDYLGAPAFREYWERQVRLARTNRVCRPVEYPFQLIYFSLALSVGLLLAGRFSRTAVLLLLGSLLVRWTVAWAISIWTDQPGLRRWMILLPVQDLLSALAWAQGLVGDRVTWRGERYRILDDGRLQAEEIPLPSQLGTGSP
jgi:ceramide glucosyltransferase